jgi:hypothetical protein
MCPIHPSSPSSWLARSRPKHDDASLSLGPGGRRTPHLPRYRRASSIRPPLGTLPGTLPGAYFFPSFPPPTLIPYLGRYLPCHLRSGIPATGLDALDVSGNPPPSSKKRNIPPLSPKTHDTPVPEPGVPSAGPHSELPGRPFRYGAYLPGLAYLFLGAGLT